MCGGGCTPCLQTCPAGGKRHTRESTTHCQLLSFLTTRRSVWFVKCALHGPDRTPGFQAFHRHRHRPRQPRAAEAGAQVPRGCRRICASREPARCLSGYRSRKLDDLTVILAQQLLILLGGQIDSVCAHTSCMRTARAWTTTDDYSYIHKFTCVLFSLCCLCGCEHR